MGARHSISHLLGFSRVGLALLSLVLAGCSSGDKDKVGVAAENCPTVGDLTVEFIQPAFSSIGLCQLNGTLTRNAVLSAGIDWRLNGVVQVGDATSNPVLVVEPGATLKGDVDNGIVEYLYVSPGASLQAIGTPSEPIIFSSSDDDFELDPGSEIGEWGGLVLEDNLSASTSIRLEYFIVAEAGASIDVGGNTYAASLSLLGEHEDSRLRYVQSHGSGGDGLSLSGGSGQNIARLEWLLITGASRDGLHASNFAGLVKDLLVIHNPGTFTDASQLGGRAGVRIGGSSAAPLLVNATLVGRDNSSDAPGINSREFGIVFEDELTVARLANIAIANFRHGCYEIGSDVDLSAMALNSDPVNDTNFVDGIHCLNETAGVDLLGEVRLGGNDIPAGLLGFNSSGDGLRGYSSGLGILFAGESGSANSATTFTASWYIESVAGLSNTTSALTRYNAGDTDESGTQTAADENFLPLFSSINDPLFSGVLGSTAASGGFNLPAIGAIRAGSASEAAQFDGWTLQDGAVEPAVTGFFP